VTDAAPAAIRDQPLIAVDVVPVTFGTAPSGAGGLRVGTATRRYEPFVGREALPGVLLDGAELLADGARRALRTKTAVDAAAVRHLAQIGAFDGPDRDPRSAAISVAFLAVVAPDVVAGSDPDVSAAVAVPAPVAVPVPVAGTVWHDVADLPLGLPFDHDRIIAAALDHARTRLWSDVPLTRALLGERFTTPDAARLTVALTGVAPDPGNLNRALRTNPALTRVDAPTDGDAGSAAAGGVRRGRGGRPPAAWTWSD
jgi:ADP-ribose pyrophosphatase YjhB (NUDIX family)